jgi:hypothetical protein
VRTPFVDVAPNPEPQKGVQKRGDYNEVARKYMGRTAQPARNARGLAQAL